MKDEARSAMLPKLLISVLEEMHMDSPVPFVPSKIIVCTPNPTEIAEIELL